MNKYFQKAKRTMNSSSVSVTLKLFLIGFLILFMLIPQHMVEDLVKERRNTEFDIQQNIATQFGGEIDVVGPLIMIPYESVVKEIIQDKNNKELTKNTIVEEYAYFTLNELDIQSNANVQNKKKSIYKIPYFQSENKLKGSFSPISFEDWKEDISPDQILWNKASVILGVSDSKGFSSIPTLKIGDQEINFKPSTIQDNHLQNPIQVVLPSDWQNHNSFEVHLNLRGTQALNFASTAQENKMVMTSNWPDPNFESTQSNLPQYKTDYIEGQMRANTLPISYVIYKDKSGFEAQWNENEFGINHLTKWRSVENFPNLESNLMGTQFLNVNNSYQKILRSVKYMVLIILLIYISFFTIELLKGDRVHPFQYILVGSAIVVFFILLLALSEYVSFGLSYFISALLTVSLIGFYSISIFKNRKMARDISILLVVIFGFIFVLLSSAENALIIGAIGLFIILASIMYATRNINWYSADQVES